MLQVDVPSNFRREGLVGPFVVGRIPDGKSLFLTGGTLAKNNEHALGRTQEKIFLDAFSKFHQRFMSGIAVINNSMPVVPHLLRESYLPHIGGIKIAVDKEVDILALVVAIMILQ